MTEFNITYATISHLMENAYNNFKIQYPYEEPWWRITCMRKRVHSRPSLSVSDTKDNWRSIDTISSVVKKIEKIDPMNIPHKVISRKIIKEQKVEDTENNSKRIGRPTTRVETTITNREYTTKELEMKADVIDIGTQHGKTSSIDYIKINTETRTLTKSELINWEGLSGGVWTDFNVETGIDQILKQSKDQADEIKALTEMVDQLMIENKNKEAIMSDDSAIRRLSDEVQKLTTELNQVILDNKEKDNIITTLTNQLMNNKNNINDEDISKANALCNKFNNESKTSHSISQLIDNYIKMQSKLNDCKRKVDAIMKKYDLFNYKEKLKEKGFILTIADLVEFFDSDYEDPEEMSDD
jgi:hypothetical protein